MPFQFFVIGKKNDSCLQKNEEDEELTGLKEQGEQQILVEIFDFSDGIHNLYSETLATIKTKSTNLNQILVDRQLCLLTLVESNFSSGK